MASIGVYNDTALSRLASNISAVTNCANPQSAMDHSLCPLSAAVIPLTDKILLPLVATVGIIGNVLNLLTLTQKEMRSSTSKTLQLLIIMSSNDLALLLLQIPQFLTHFAVSVKTFYSFYFVYVRYPLSNILLTCNVWLTVAITTERCVAFTKHKSAGAGSKRCAKRSCRQMLAQALQSGKHIGFVLIALSTALNLPKFFDLHVAKLTLTSPVANATLNETRPFEEAATKWFYQSTAFGANPTYQKVAFWGAAMLVTVVPMFVLVVLTGVLVFRIDQHRKRKQRLATWQACGKQDHTTCDYDASPAASALARRDTQVYVHNVHNGNGNGGASPNGYCDVQINGAQATCRSVEMPSTPESPLPLTQLHAPLGTYMCTTSSDVVARTPFCYVPNTITILVVCIVVVFILTDWLAFYLISMIAIFGRDEVMRLDTTQALRHISNLLVVANSSTNFILFCSTSKKYRAVFLHRLCRIRMVNERERVL